MLQFLILFIIFTKDHFLGQVGHILVLNNFMLVPFVFDVSAVPVLILVPFCVCFMLPDSTVPVLILVPFFCVFYVTRFYCSSTYTGSISVCVLCYQILLFQYLYWFHFCVCFMLPDSTVPVLHLLLVQCYHVMQKDPLFNHI